MQTGTRPAARAALEVLLTDAAVGESGTRRFVPPGAAAKTALGLARRPRSVARRVVGLGGELSRVVRGTSEVRPPKGDRRFADPAWETNWLLQRLLQAYLAVGDTADELITDAMLDWRSERQARFALANILDALAPTNFPWSNPVVMREIVNQGGANLVRGARRLAGDISLPPRLPASVDTSNFAVGENIAVTPGAIVLRTDVFELIHYQPQTDQVYEVPLLFVPPTINKYYILDLAPGRSLIEWLVQQGHQVFTISWRNPDSAQGHFDFDTYADAVLQARVAVGAIAREEAVHVNGVCSGGIIAAGALGSAAATEGLAGAASLTLSVCAIDNSRLGEVSAFLSRELASAAVAESARKGYLDGQALAGVFAWLRPNDLIWNYVVNNYLLGKDPPAFDILYWNQDTVHLAAGAHRDFIRLSLDNSLTRPQGFTVLGQAVDLRDVDLDSYVIAGAKDHIVPWENAYRSTQLLGGTSRFVLSKTGHIQTMVNPPSPESRAAYQVAEDCPPDPAGWQAKAPTIPGSWWTDYSEWLAARSGPKKAAPARLGNRAYPALAKSPGTYVYAQ